MKIEETSISSSNLEECALSGLFREGSTSPRSMSAIRINVEEAPNNDVREDLVRDVSPTGLIDAIIDNSRYVVTRFISPAIFRGGGSQGNHACLSAFY